MPLSNIRLDARAYLIVDQIKRLTARTNLLERNTFDDLVSNTLRLGFPTAEIEGIGDAILEGDMSVEGSLNIGSPSVRAAQTSQGLAVAGNLRVEGTTELVGSLGDISAGAITGTSLDVGSGAIDGGNATLDRLEIGVASGTPGAGDLYVADELSVDGISNLGTVAAGAITGSSLNLGSGSLDAGDAEFTGDVTTDGGIYAGSRTANPPSGEIAATGDIIAGGGMAIGNVSAGPATGNLLFYSGGTNVGQISVQDTTWLRINQAIAKNIYTPRYIRADAGLAAGSSVVPTAGEVESSANITAGSDFIAAAGGIRVGGVAVTPATGDVVYTGALTPSRGGGTVDGYVMIPYTTPKTHTSYDGDDKADATGTITLTAFGVADNCRFVLCQILVKSSSVGTPTDQYFAVGPSSTYWYGISCRPQVNGRVFEAVAWVPTSSGGDLSYRIVGPTSGTFNVWIRIWGYAI